MCFNSPPPRLRLDKDTALMFTSVCKAIRIIISIVVGIAIHTALLSRVVVQSVTRAPAPHAGSVDIGTDVVSGTDRIQVKYFHFVHVKQQG